MDDIEILYRALSVEAAYDLCLDALNILREARLVSSAAALQVAVLAILTEVDYKDIDAA